MAPEINSFLIISTKSPTDPTDPENRHDQSADQMYQENHFKQYTVVKCCRNINPAILLDILKNKWLTQSALFSKIMTVIEITCFKKIKFLSWSETLSDILAVNMNLVLLKSLNLFSILIKIMTDNYQEKNFKRLSSEPVKVSTDLIDTFIRFISFLIG